jgi:hypothetical protein
VKTVLITRCSSGYGLETGAPLPRRAGTSSPRGHPARGRAASIGRLRVVTLDVTRPEGAGDTKRLVDAFHVAEYVQKAANAIESFRRQRRRQSCRSRRQLVDHGILVVVAVQERRSPAPEHAAARTLDSAAMANRKFEKRDRRASRRSGPGRAVPPWVRGPFGIPAGAS